MKIFDFLYSKELTYRKEVWRILGIKFAFPRKEKTIAFLETRGLGDYILMHNFLKYVKKSRKYRDYNIILIIRKNFLSLAEAYDSQYADEILCVDTRGASSVLNKLETEELVCLYSGQEKFEKIWLKKIKAKRKLVCNIHARVSEFQTKILQKAFENLIEEKIEDFNYPYFTNTDNEIRENSIFISPFANHALRCWELEKYAMLINQITEHYTNEIVILGEEPNRGDIERLISMCNKKEKIINTAGRFSVKSLYDNLSKKACLLVANETGTIHLAMCGNVNTICISNGSFYGLYLPYNRDNIRYVFPQDFDYKFNRGLAKYDINSIEVSDVYTHAEYFLKAFNVNRLTVNNV